MLNLFILLAFSFVLILAFQSCCAWVVSDCASKKRFFSSVYRCSDQRPSYVQKQFASYTLSCRVPVRLSAKENEPVDKNDEVSGFSAEDETLNWEEISAELLSEDEDDGLNDKWVPDREKARLKKKKYEQLVASEYNENATREMSITESQPRGASFSANRPSSYTDEEEAIIEAMGGRSKRWGREPGFLGDSSLAEICTDYSVPISYLADVLCMWGVPIPIHIHDKLGDLVTGEQAFAIVEAVNTLDVAALHDRYSNTNIQQLCFEWGIDLQHAFEMAMREGWSLPFGVQTCLRVEQEQQLLRVLGSQSGLLDISDDEGTDDY
jgi:hypothetical protein